MHNYSLGSPYGCYPCEALEGKFHKEPFAEFVEDPIAVWGQIRGAKELLAKSRNFYRLDHAYHGRLRFFRMCKGEFQPSVIRKRPADRWERLGLKVSPWKQGKHVLVTLSDPKTYEFFGVDFRNVVEEIRKHTDRPVVIRERRAKHPISEDLKNAHCLVTYASNSVVDALLSGVPVFPLGPSIARPMGKPLEQIESPLYPAEREEFFRHMAYCQFTLDEFASGFALKTADEQDTLERVQIDGDQHIRGAANGGSQLA